MSFLVFDPNSLLEAAMDFMVALEKANALPERTAQAAIAEMVADASILEAAMLHVGRTLQESGIEGWLASDDDAYPQSVLQVLDKTCNYLNLLQAVGIDVSRKASSLSPRLSELLGELSKLGLAIAKELRENQ